MRPPRRCHLLLPATLLTGAACAWTALAQNELAPPGGPPPLSEAAPPAAGAAPLPERPASGLLDEGDVFDAEERIQMEADLEDFRARTGLWLYMVIKAVPKEEEGILETDREKARRETERAAQLEATGSNLLKAWTREGPGLLIAYEWGSDNVSIQGSPVIMKAAEMRKWLQFGQAAAKTPPKGSTVAQRLRGVVHALTMAGETWRQSGKLPQRSGSQVPASPGPDAPPEAPIDFVRDDGNLIPDEQEAALKSELIKFHSRWDFDVYVVSATWLADQAAEQWAAGLVQRWVPGRRAVVIAYNRGTAAGDTGEKPLALCATAEAETFLGPVAWQKLTTMAPEVWRTEEEQPKGTGLLRVARFTMETIEARTAGLQKAAGHGSLSGQSTVLMGLAGALVVGSGALFIFHRLQERLEARSNEQFRFPEVKVRQRLGASQGGGLVTGGSFRQQNPK